MKDSTQSRNVIIKYVIFVIVSVIPLVSFSLLPFFSINQLGNLSFWDLLKFIRNIGIKIRFIHFIGIIAGAGVIVGHVIRRKAIACVCSVVGALYLLSILGLVLGFGGWGVLKLIGIGSWLALAGFIINIITAFNIGR